MGSDLQGKPTGQVGEGSMRLKCGSSQAPQI